MQQRRIGAHVSMAGGLVTAAQNVMDMGGNALQIFWVTEVGQRKPFVKKRQIRSSVLQRRFWTHIYPCAVFGKPYC
jgi:endonuclease IV